MACKIRELRNLEDDEVKELAITLSNKGMTRAEIAKTLSVGVTTLKDFLDKRTYKSWWDSRATEEDGVYRGPKILVVDIETAYMRGNFWRMFDEISSLDQIETDWYILSWAAKWMHEDQVMFASKKESWDTEEDSELLVGIWQLLDEADFIITQNGKKFDIKKLNARFVINGMQPPSSFRHIDVLEIAKKHFGFTSNKLEYMTGKLCKKYKKLKHGKFPGRDLWIQCLKGNMEAWDEMEEYNIYDILSLEELYTILRPWFKKHPNFNLYYGDNELRCSCGCSDKWIENGYDYTNLSKFRRWRCTNCGAEVTDRVNLLSKDKRASLKRNVNHG